jgi:uncharacterized glyoxalase superfamily protein PhnB
MSQTVFPIIRYRDPAAGIDFLERAFGFERRQVHADDRGQVAHAELQFRGSLVMLGPGEGEKAQVYVVVEDADAHHARAVEAGAAIAMEPTDQDYGSRDYAAWDPEGNRWFFGTYAPG